MSIQKITLQDKDYPAILKELHSPPKIIYIKGKIIPKDKLAIGIVGTRKCTDYGKEIAYKLSSELSKLGITIVSGLAQGIDTYAHKGALDNKARTIAILGTGIDKKSFYPLENYDLSEQIAENGAIISEYEQGSRGTKYSFPQRNRIISGLSLGVIVIEAPEKSGALITADFALEQNKEVFVVPGPINSENSKGTNKLIKQGAKLITNIHDILEELNLTYLLK